MVLNSCLTIHMLIQHKSLVNLLFKNSRVVEGSGGGGDGRGDRDGEHM